MTETTHEAIRADFKAGRHVATAQKVATLRPGPDVASDVLWMGGVANFALRRLNIAVGCFEAALLNNGRMGAAWSSLGLVRFELRQFGLAEQAWSRAAALGVEEPRNTRLRHIIRIMRGQETFDPQALRDSIAEFDHERFPDPANFVPDPAVRLPVVFALGAQRAMDIALTIDDGPSRDISPVVLATLRDHGVPATHFIVGSMAEAHTDQIAQMISLGHGVYSHSWSHAIFPNLTADEIAEELEKTEAVLSRFRPTPSPYPFRLPGGIGWSDPKVHAAIRAWNPDTILIHWSVTSYDHQAPLDFARPEDISLDAEIRTLDTVLDPVFSAPVVLMHDCMATTQRKDPRAFSALFGKMCDVGKSLGMRFVAPTPAEWAAVAR